MIRWRVSVAAIALIAMVMGIARPAVALATTSIATSRPATSVGAPGLPHVVRQRPCPQSRFTCITLRVPRDHFATPGGPTFDVTFGLLRASGQRKGVFVTVTGGPGTSGLAAADSYTDAFDPRIPGQYDIVFFDQRGVGLSEPLQCPTATLAWYTTPAVPTISRAQASQFAQAAAQYARDCVAETGVAPSELPYFSTRQAVEDLEAFRTYLGVDTLTLYGESYGTQYAQTYAAAHPDRLAALLIDGAVDLTLSGTDYYAEDARAFETSLTTTLDACSQARLCRRDLESSGALATYDRLAADLRNGPRVYDWVTASGHIERREFGLGDLETAAEGYVYSNFDRMLFQRAMAQASRGQLAPLARLTYISLGQEPETLLPVIDPSYSDAMYYAVECMDYAYGSGTAAQRAAAFLAAGERAAVASVRLGSVFYGDLPCAYWPVHPSTEVRPRYLTATTYPVFVLNSSIDPATPYAGALRIYEHLTNGYLITQPGGPHVIFGRGVPCPDDPVSTFLVKGRLPAHRQTTCPATGPDPYVPIPAERARDYRDGLDAMVATDNEINYGPDYWSWDGTGSLQIGCLHAGWLRYQSFADGSRVTLSGCAFSVGLPLTGSGMIDDAAGTFRLSVSAPGGTRLSYRRTAGGTTSVTGTFRPLH